MITAYIVTATGPEVAYGQTIFDALADAVARHLGDPDAVVYCAPAGHSVTVMPDLGIQTAAEYAAWADAHGSALHRCIARRLLSRPA